MVQFIDKKEPLSYRPLPAAMLKFVTNEHGLRMFRHRFLTLQYDIKLNGYITNIITRKENEAKKLLAEKDWIQYVLAHDSQYKLKAAKEVFPVCSSKEKADLIRLIWREHSTIREHRRKWHALFNDTPAVFLMNKFELRAFAKLPPKVMVYRGLNVEGAVFKKHGFSWTLSRDEAIRYANIGIQKPVILSAEVYKDDIHAMFLHSGGREVIITKLIEFKTEEL